MSRIRPGIVALIFGLTAMGCRSLDRLVDNSPLNLAGGASTERVNLWPLIYKNGDRMAVLWPIYDQDRKGFALRPLVTKDQTKWEVLPPIAFFDTATGDWVVLPAYKIGGSHGLFPIYNRGWLNNVGPIWWDQDADGSITGGGLLPISRLGPGFNYVGPAWWCQETGGYVRRGGLFPIAYLSPGFNYAGPVFWRRNEAGKLHGGGVFPVAWISRSLSYVGPAWWQHDSAGELAAGGLFPAAYFSPTFNHVGPVWWTDQNSGLFPIAKFGKGLNYVTLAYWNKDDDGEFESGGLLPIAHFSDGFNYLGPAWWRHGTDGTDGTDGTPAAWGLFPLMAKSANLNHVGPVFWYHQPNGASTVLTPLGSTHINADGSVEWCNVLGPLFHYAKTPDGSWFVALTPFLTRSEGADYSAWKVWPLLGRRVQRHPDGSTRWAATTALAGLVKFEGRDKTERARVFPLFSYRAEDGGEPSVADWLSLFCYQDRGESGSSLHCLTPLVFNYRRDGENYQWNSLLGTVSFEARSDESAFSFLYFLYRQKTKGTETRRDIFPFITLDTGEKQSGFSFLWRLLRWQRKGEKVGGHFLFIPWGEDLD